MDFRILLIKVCLKHPFTALRYFNRQNLRKFVQALREEPREQILENIHQYLVSAGKANHAVPIIHKNNSLKIIESHLFDPAYFIRHYYENTEDIEKAYLQPIKVIYNLAVDTKSRFLTPLFSYQYYADIIGRELDPLGALSHYLVQGYKTGLRPHPLFDSTFYTHSYLTERPGKINPLLHYVLKCRLDYTNPNGVFDTQFYLTKNIDILNSSMNPLSHYIEFGYKENRNPSPLFDLVYVRNNYNVPQHEDPLTKYLLKDEEYHKTHHFFDGKYFLEENKLEPTEKTPLERYLELEHFDKKPSAKFDPEKFLLNRRSVKKKNPLIHFLTDGALTNNYSTLNLSNALVDQVTKAQKIEHLIFRPHKQPFSVPNYSIPNKNSDHYKLLKSLKGSISRGCSHLFLFSSLRRGGAELEALHILEALTLDPRNDITVFYTDDLHVSASDWFPKDSSIELVDFHKCNSSASPDDRLSILLHAIEIIRPNHIINTNSKVGWELYRKYGKPLNQLTKLNALLFCYDHDANGVKCGYAVDYIRDTIIHLDKIFVDNENFVTQLVHDFGLPEILSEKLVTLYHYPDLSLRTVKIDIVLKNGSSAKPRILWASRICGQKRPDRVIEIAKKLPQVTFDLWGYGNIHDFVNDIPSNVILKGAYKHLSEIKLTNYFAFLYTSDWDGLPNILVDMIKVGLPVVTGNVGGISELIDEQSGWLVQEPDDVEGYVSNIQEILLDRDIVRSKVQLLSSRIEETFNQKDFVASITHKLSISTPKKAAKT